MSRSQVSSAAFVLWVAFAPMPAGAAVRKCGEITSSEIATAATEQDAKKKALQQWHDQALKLGDGFESWRLAADKSLKCFPKDNGFECVAFGRPCIVDQTPNSPPKPRDDKGQGI